VAELEIRRWESPDETRRFERGRFEVMDLGGMKLGRASYEPGWRWSTDVGAGPDDRCQVEHIGMVVSGRAAVLMDDGTETTMKPGDLFHVPPGHDSWVVGDEPYVSLHFLGADHYAE
jgi:mannose-6-phosphate isomerase-like protein (cupin superfamily)